MDSVYQKTVRGDLEQIGERLEQAVQARDYSVLGRIDLKEKMHSKGVEFGPACRVYEVCNPHRAKQVLEREMSISTALPCRIALYESGDAFRLATLKPRTILAGFGKPELDDEARQVEEDLEAIIDAVAGEFG